MVNKIYSILVALFILGLVIIPVQSNAQVNPRVEGFTVYGIVYSPDNLPVEGAIVYVKNTRTGEILTTSTNEDGKYQIETLNFPSGIVNGDILQVMATYGNFTAYDETSVQEGSFGARVDLHLSDPICQADDTSNEMAFPQIIVNSGSSNVELLMIVQLLILTVVMGVIAYALINHQKKRVKL